MSSRRCKTSAVPVQPRKKHCAKRKQRALQMISKACSAPPWRSCVNVKDMRQSGMVSPSPQDDDPQFDAALRPTSLEDFEGQAHVREQLHIAIEAAKRRGEAMDHVLLCGPPGLGKTTLAGIIAHELGVPIDQTSGPVLQKKLDLTGIVSSVRAHQVFFI